jgi:hypothetical protein
MKAGITEPNKIFIARQLLRKHAPVYNKYTCNNRNVESCVYSGVRAEAIERVQLARTLLSDAATKQQSDKNIVFYSNL